VFEVQVLDWNEVIDCAALFRCDAWHVHFSSKKKNTSHWTVHTSHWTVSLLSESPHGALKIRPAKQTALARHFNFAAHAELQATCSLASLHVARSPISFLRLFACGQRLDV